MRGLKVTLALFGAVLVIEGLGECAASAALPMAVLGATWVAAGVFTALAARDPVRHVAWVRFAIALPVALALGLLACALRGDVTLGAIAVELGFDALFVVLLAIFYPRARGAAPADPA